MLGVCHDRQTPNFYLLGYILLNWFSVPAFVNMYHPSGFFLTGQQCTFILCKIPALTSKSQNLRLVKHFDHIRIYVSNQDSITVTNSVV
jgi:hypothetical protein